jgi:hypothetical protein
MLPEVNQLILRKYTRRLFGNSTISIHLPNYLDIRIKGIMEQGKQVLSMPLAMLILCLPLLLTNLISK